ncbi:hypothetical protein F9K33_12550 [bacterium]|nr:MAG: hypothetical protein F9K33_12550 [bacterium]
MHLTLLLHILAGTLGLVSGAVALSVLKGGKLHRKSGIIFIYTMVAMSLAGAVLAAIPHQGLHGNPLGPQRFSVVGGVLTFYLVITGLLSVRHPGRSRWIDASAMLLALTVGSMSIKFGFDGLNNNGELDGQPAAPGFVFGAVAILAALGDMRMIIKRGLQGTRRIARHLWRVCFAMFIAAFSFFLGQAQVIPEPIRIIPLLALLALAPLIVMFYWLWRVRIKQTLKDTFEGASHEPTS